MIQPSAFAPSGAGAELLKLVGFRIEDWRFAVRLGQVRTSIMPCPITRVFHVPEFIRGIISLRGTIVGVLDLGRLLGVSSDGRGFRRFLVVGGRSVQAAIPVHDVFRLPEVSVEMISALPSSVTPSQKQYFEGIINTTNLAGWESAEQADTVTLIDVDMVFDAPPIRALRVTP